MYNPFYPFGQSYQSNQFAWVQGEASAKAYVVPVGATVVLLDTESPVLYMKSTDMNGRPQEMQKRYLVTEEQYEKLDEMESAPPVEYVTKEEFEAYVKEAEKKFAVK